MKKIIFITILSLFLTGCFAETETENDFIIEEEENIGAGIDVVVEDPLGTEPEIIKKAVLTAKQECQNNYTGIVADVDDFKNNKMDSDALAKWNELGCDSIVFPDCNNLGKAKVSDKECLEIAQGIYKIKKPFIE